MRDKGSKGMAKGALHLALPPFIGEVGGGGFHSFPSEDCNYN